mgnify:CR=1 FL=1
MSKRPVAMITGVTTQVPIIVFALHKDGRRVPTQVTTAPIHNEAGEIIGGVETFRDVSPILVDLERAQKIQRQALQQDLPKDPRLRFSTFFMSYDIVGGDYYAIQAIDADRYGFLLADMEGHGVAAALYAMHLSILWNRHFKLLKSPADFAAAVNEDLVKIFGSVVTFATAMCGIIDASAGTMCFTGAGGPTPLIIHENWAVDEPKSTGPPLGVMQDIPYKEKTVKLEAGDSILLFSDGATEIQNAQNEWLGVEGFTQICHQFGLCFGWIWSAFRALSRRRYLFDLIEKCKIGTGYMFYLLSESAYVFELSCTWLKIIFISGHCIR